MSSTMCSLSFKSIVLSKHDTLVMHTFFLVGSVSTFFCETGLAERPSSKPRPGLFPSTILGIMEYIIIRWRERVKEQDTKRHREIENSFRNMAEGDKRESKRTTESETKREQQR